MSSGKKSDVWEFFNRIDHVTSACNICKHIFRHKSNTTNLRDHLVRKHKDLYTPKKQKSDDEAADDPGKPKQRKLTDYAKDSVTPYARGSQRKKDLDYELIIMITTDLEPFSIVTKKGFQRFVKKLDPRYILPDRRTISDVLLPDLYLKSKKKLIEIFQATEYVALTSDMWTSIAGDSYITVTAHFVLGWDLKNAVLGTKQMTERHTAVNIAEAVRAILEEYEISQKIFCMVTDNASNMKKAASELRIKHLNCFAHTLQLVITDSLEAPSVKNIITKAKDIVTTFKSSNVAGEILKNEQQRLSQPPLRLIQEVPTRWNSTFYMIKRILEVGDSLVVAISKLEHSKIVYFTAEEVLVLKDLVTLLSVFEEATKNASGQDYVTSSLIIPIVYCLKDEIVSAGTTINSPIGREVHHLLISGIDERLVAYETRTIPQLATIVDPRWKTKPFLKPDNAESAQKALQNAVSYYLKKTDEQGRSRVGEEGLTLESDITQPGPSTSDDRTKSFFRKLETRKEAERNQRTTTADSIITVRQYLQEVALREDEVNCFEYWKCNEHKLAPIGSIAKKYLSVPATSVPSERIFSAAGEIIDENRSRLHPTKADQQIFLKANLWLLE